MRIGKLLAALFGVLILLAGIGMTTAGAVGLAVTNGDGWVTAPTARIETDTAAVVGSDINIDLGDAIDERTFVSFADIPAHIEVDSRNGKDVFVGIGPRAEVEAYIEGTAHARVDLFDDNVDVFTRDGGVTVAVPVDQTFWETFSTDGNLDWDLESGNWSVVVANADGSSGVDVAVTGSARIPFIEAIVTALLIIGLVAIAGGATMLYFGVRADPRAPVPAPAAPATPTAPEPEATAIVR